MSFPFFRSNKNFFLKIIYLVLTPTKNPDLVKYAITHRQKNKFDNLFKTYNTNYLVRHSSEIVCIISLK